MRTTGWLLALAALCKLSESASAQDIVRPREFILLRPQEPSPAPFIMAPINVQPLSQTQWSWKSNNPQQVTMQPLKPQPVVPQGNRWQNENYRVQDFQLHNWSANSHRTLGGHSASPQFHRQALSW
jgi:hypothetical protein